MRIGNQATSHRPTGGPGKHRDLANFRQLVKDARSDGEVTDAEKQKIGEAFQKLEPGEKAAVRHGRKHQDALRFRNQVKKAFADGKLDPQERQQLGEAFSKLEAGEKQRAVDALAQHGHQRLAISLSGG